MLTYDPSLSQHVQRACVTLADVLPRKSTASLSRLPATGERLLSLRNIFQKTLFTNKYGRTRPLRHHLLPRCTFDESKSKKYFPKILRLGAFAQNNILDFYQRAFVHFCNLGPILPLRTGFSPFLSSGAYAHFGSTKLWGAFCTPFCSVWKAIAGPRTTSCSLQFRQIAFQCEGHMRGNSRVMAEHLGSARVTYVQCLMFYVGQRGRRKGHYSSAFQYLVWRSLTDGGFFHRPPLS